VLGLGFEEVGGRAHPGKDGGLGEHGVGAGEGPLRWADCEGENGVVSYAIGRPLPVR